MYQQDFVRDTFNPGVVLGFVMATIAVIGMLLLGIFTAGAGAIVGTILLSTGYAGFIGTAIGVALQTGGSVNSPKFIASLYDMEFEPIVVTQNERRPWTCTGDQCYKRKYLNSVSYKSDINKYGIEPYLNTAFLLSPTLRQKTISH